MRLLLTHLLSVAMVCLFSTLAAQPPVGFGATEPPAMVSTPLAIRLADPVSSGKGRVLLQWSLPGGNDSGFIKVERSAFQHGPFEVLAVLRRDSGVVHGQFTDDQPFRGTNHYRIKYVLANGGQELSRIATTGLGGGMACRFYPNPVDNMLIVRSEQSLDLLLSDGNGKPRLSMKLKAGLQTVDVSNLEKGLYIITLTQTETGRSITEKLVKN